MALRDDERAYMGDTLVIELADAAKVLVEGKACLRGPPLYPEHGTCELESTMHCIVANVFTMAGTMNKEGGMTTTQYTK